MNYFQKLEEMKSKQLSKEQINEAHKLAKSKRAKQAQKSL